MTRQDADAGDVPAHTIGLGYDEAAIVAAEDAEERAAAAAVANGLVLPSAGVIAAARPPIGRKR